MLYVPVNKLSVTYVGAGLPALNQYLARINVSCSRTQHGDAGEARTFGLESSTQTLIHRAHCQHSKFYIDVQSCLIVKVRNRKIFFSYFSIKTSPPK